MEFRMIGAIEDYILHTIRTELACYANLDTVSIESGPGEWDGEYLQELIPQLPAIRVVWGGATAREETALSLDSIWTIYAINGWDALDEQARRRAANGAYAVLAVLAPLLHNSRVKHLTTGDQLGLLRVDTIENMWDGAHAQLPVSIYGIDLTMMSAHDYEPPPVVEKALDDFLRSGVTYDLEGGDDPDSQEVVNMRGNE